MAKSTVNHVPTMEAGAPCEGRIPHEGIETSHSSIMIDQRKELLGELVFFGSHRGRLSIRSGSVDWTSNGRWWNAIRTGLLWRRAYNSSYLPGYADGGGGCGVLRDVEAVGSNGLHLHNVITLSSPTSCKENNQNQTEQIPEFLVDTHNSSIRDKMIP